MNKHSIGSNRMLAKSCLGPRRLQVSILAIALYSLPVRQPTASAAWKIGGWITPDWARPRGVERNHVRRGTGAERPARRWGVFNKA